MMSHPSASASQSVSHANPSQASLQLRGCRGCSRPPPGIRPTTVSPHHCPAQLDQQGRARQGPSWPRFCTQFKNTPNARSHKGWRSHMAPAPVHTQRGSQHHTQHPPISDAPNSSPLAAPAPLPCAAARPPPPLLLRAHTHGTHTWEIHRGCVMMTHSDPLLNCTKHTVDHIHRSTHMHRTMQWHPPRPSSS